MAPALDPALVGNLAILAGAGLVLAALARARRSRALRLVRLLAITALALALVQLGYHAGFA